MRARTSIHTPARASDRQWGDFQTPPELAARVCQYLAATGPAPRLVVEPTCGEGRFLRAALAAFPSLEHAFGVEIQPAYARRAAAALREMPNRAATAEVVRADIFTYAFPPAMLAAEGVLLLGNPPWVTSAELGGLRSDNLPRKRNLKGLNGLAALTGKSNFDLAEAVILRLLELFSERRGRLAMLCKNAVIRNLVEILPRTAFKVSRPRALLIDAPRDFGAAVDAALLVMDLGERGDDFTCEVATLDRPRRAGKRFGWSHGRFVADVKAYDAARDIDGRSPFEWRQGVKHDCAGVMELVERGGRLFNGEGEAVNVENEFVYPLLKSSDLRRFEVGAARRCVIMPQRAIGEETARLAFEAPRLWRYLTRHAARLDARRSSIYRGRPRFSIFGVGAYSFAPFKVAVSGLYKTPRFALVPPLEGRPAIFDDTCYFLSFDDYRDALFTATLLHGAPAEEFLRAVVFTDAKRPFTKDVLMRVDLARVAARLSFADLRRFWDETGYVPRKAVRREDYEAFRSKFENRN